MATAKLQKDSSESTEVIEFESTEAGAPRFVLKKNHGLVVGRTHRHFTAGTEFDPVKDSELIPVLVRNGAIFE